MAGRRYSTSWQAVCPAITVHISASPPLSASQAAQYAVLGQARVPISAIKITGGGGGPFLSMYSSSVDLALQVSVPNGRIWGGGGEGGGRDKENLSDLEFRSSS